MSPETTFDSLDSSLLKAFGLSVLLHLVLVAAGNQVALREGNETKMTKPIEVIFRPLPEAETPPARQYVTPSAQSLDRPVTSNPRFLSDRDSYALKETIRRGIPDKPDKAVPTKQKLKDFKAQRDQAPSAGQGNTKTKSTQRAEVPSSGGEPGGDIFLGDKLLSNSALLPAPMKQGKLATNNASTDAKISLGESKLNRETPFMKQHNPPLVAGTNSLALGGSADFLPDIPDGNITLLNTKADRFSIFVRRVSLQVFGAIRQLNWQELPYHEIQAIDDYAVVEAEMSPSGKLLKATMLSPSGSNSFDRLLHKAVTTGTWDQNPPQAALSDDGTIKFIFKARTWARPAPDGTREQRWVMLGTGLL